MRRGVLSLALLVALTWAEPVHAAMSCADAGDGAIATNTTTVATGTFAVTAGDVIATWVKHEDPAATIAVTGGSNTFTAGTKKTHANGDTHGQWHYVLSANAGTYAVTATFGSNVTFASIIAFRCTYSGTLAVDGHAENSSGSAGTAITSGNLTTTGSDTTVMCGYAEYSAAAVSSAAFNGGAADSTYSLAGGGINNTVAWRRAIAAGATGACTGTLDASADWIVNGIAFTATAGGGATPTPRLMLLGVGGDE